MSESQTPERRPDAAQLIEERRFREAIASLNTRLAEDSGGRLHALVAAAHYGLEEYGDAAEHYERAAEARSKPTSLARHVDTVPCERGGRS